MTPTAKACPGRHLLPLLRSQKLLMIRRCRDAFRRGMVAGASEPHSRGRSSMPPKVRLVYMYNYIPYVLEERQE